MRAACRNRLQKCLSPRLLPSQLDISSRRFRRQGDRALGYAANNGGSDPAAVRSLGDGRRTTVAVRIRQIHDDLGLTTAPTSYRAFRRYGL